MIRALWIALLVAAPAVAQNAAEKDRPAERPRLNLRLDNPSSFAREAPPENKKEEPKGLPGLGADARKIEPGGPSKTLPGNGPVPREDVRE